jgi:hypothetical protein
LTCEAEKLWNSKDKLNQSIVIEALSAHKLKAFTAFK